MKIGVFFGSRSTEHDVSIISAINVINELRKHQNYQITPVYINRSGQFEVGENLDNLEAHQQINAKGKEVSIEFSNKKVLILKEKGIFGKRHEIELAFLVMHGMNGEDGTLQGLMELAQIPYTGSGVLGSALGMDKIAMKDVLKSNNLPLVPYLSFRRHDWQENEQEILKRIVNKLSFPIFVKPANLGSSIGISKAKNEEELAFAIEVASNYDSRIICEEGIDDLQEINCAIIGPNSDPESSLLEEPITYRDFLTFDEKYINQGGTMQGVKSKVKIPAPLASEELAEEISLAAKKTFQVLNCSGIARVDFLVNTKTNEFFVNEINTIPGSLQQHLFEKSGIPGKLLVEKIIETALEREREKEKNIFAFRSEILLKGSTKK